MVNTTAGWAGAPGGQTMTTKLDATQQFPERIQTVPLSLEQKMEISEQIYITLKGKMIERYGTPMVIESKTEKSRFTISWFPKRGGRQTTLSVSVNTLGGIRVEFSRATMQGIGCKSTKHENGLVVRLHDGTFMGFKDDPEKLEIQANIYPGVMYHAIKSTQQLVMELVETILMA